MSSIAKAMRLAKGGPSEAQKEAGNYRKFHTSIHGLDVAIENLKGTKRTGKGKNGKPWSVTMPAHYGYIKGTEGADGDQVDVYLGPDHSSKNVFVVNQKDHGTGKFDEHKVMLGFPDLEAAKKAYIGGFSDGKGHLRIGSIESMDIEKFKHWVKDEEATDRIARASGGKIPKTHNPGNGAPKEKAIYVNAAEEEIVKRALGHAGKATKQGVESFVDPSGAYGGDLSGNQTSSNYNGSGSRPSSGNPTGGLGSNQGDGADSGQGGSSSTSGGTSSGHGSSTSSGLSGGNTSSNTNGSQSPSSHDSGATSTSGSNGGLSGAESGSGAHPDTASTSTKTSGPSTSMDGPNVGSSSTVRPDAATAAVMSSVAMDPGVSAAMARATTAMNSHGTSDPTESRPATTSTTPDAVASAATQLARTPLTLDAQLASQEKAKAGSAPVASAAFSPSVMAAIAKLMGYGDTQVSNTADKEDAKTDSVYANSYNPLASASYMTTKPPQTSNVADKVDSSFTTVPETMDYNPLSSAGYMTPNVTRSNFADKVSTGDVTTSDAANKADSTFTTANETPFRYDPLNTATADALTPNPSIADLARERAYLNRVPDLGFAQKTMKSPADGHNMQGGLGALTFDSHAYNTVAAAQPTISPAVDTPPERPVPNDFITGNMSNLMKALKSGTYSTRGIDDQTGLGVPDPVQTNISPVGYSPSNVDQAVSIPSPDSIEQPPVPGTPPVSPDRVSVKDVPPIPSAGLYPKTPQNDLYGDMTRNVTTTQPASPQVSNYYQGRWVRDAGLNPGSDPGTQAAVAANDDANPFNEAQMKAARLHGAGFNKNGGINPINMNNRFAKIPQYAGLGFLVNKGYELAGGSGDGTASSAGNQNSGHGSSDQIPNSKEVKGGTFESALASARDKYASNPTPENAQFIWYNPDTGQTSTYLIGNYARGGKVRSNNAISNALRMSIGG